jgi:hypothetical protein
VPHSGHAADDAAVWVHPTDQDKGLILGTNKKGGLHVYAFDGSSSGPSVYGTASTWSETGLTWNNRPARVGSATDTKGAVGANTWVEFNVTPLVTGNGSVSFNLVPNSTNGVDFFAREGTQKPELVITVQ